MFQLAELEASQAALKSKISALETKPSSDNTAVSDPAPAENVAAAGDSEAAEPEQKPEAEPDQKAEAAPTSADAPTGNYEVSCFSADFS